jgi:S-adenosylmethionine synthetase
MSAAYGHVGRKNRMATWQSKCNPALTREVELFTWEKLDRVDDIRRAFAL